MNPAARSRAAGVGDRSLLVETKPKFLHKERWAKISSIEKSSRHSKITGDFGEHLTLYLLSKHEFECARIDHTGMDIIARNPMSNEVIGISVKSRSREAKQATGALKVPPDVFRKLLSACAAFKCVPYFSFVFDRDDKISVYMMSESVLRESCPNARKGLNWSMTPSATSRYCSHQNV
jgi:hypothetical protein